MFRIDRTSRGTVTGLGSDSPDSLSMQQRGERHQHRAGAAAEVLHDNDLMRGIFRTIPPNGLKGPSAVNRIWRAEALSTITEATLSPKDLLTKPLSSRFRSLRSVTLNAFDDTQSPERRTDMLRQLSGLAPTLSSVVLRRSPGYSPDWYLIPDDFDEEHVRTICEAATNLEALTIETRQVLSAGVLESIGKLPNLRALSVRIDDCSSRELSFLKQLGNFEALDLDCNADDETVRTICAVAPHLKTLRMETREPLGAGVLAHVGRLSKLTNLSVYVDGLHAEGLSGLKGIIGQLESLNLAFEHGVPQVVPNLEFLRDAKNLRCLTLEPECEWDDEALAFGLDASQIAPVASLASLTHLSLRNMPLDDQALAPLAALTGLRALDIGRDYRFPHLPEIAGDGLGHLSGMTRLEILSMAGTLPDGNASLKHLAPLVALKHLDLNGAEIDATGIAHLASVHRLTELGLGNCPDIDNDGLAEIAKLRTLRCLDLSYDFESPEGLDLSSLNRLSALERLNLRGIYSGGHRMDDEVAERLLASLIRQGCRIQTRW